MNTINIIGYNPCSVADGDGLREVLYIALCTHHCPFCQNQKYWNDNGKEYEIDYLVNKLNSNPLTNITLSGGDGLTVQYDSTLKLLKELKNKTNKTIWVYTGYTWEELINSDKSECLQYIDILVDGRFEIDKRDITLKFRGSSNQRVINVKESLKQNKVIELELD